MQKSNFISQLQKRASEQRVVLQDVPYPKIFLFISRQFGEYPWKKLIPFSVAVTIVLHVWMGSHFDEWVLWLFGKI